MLKEPSHGTNNKEPLFLRAYKWFNLPAGGAISSASDISRRGHYTRAFT